MTAHGITRVLGHVVGLAVATVWTLLSAPIGIPSAAADPCPGVEVAFARGTGEGPGIGRVGVAFVDALKPQIGGRPVSLYPVNYPATFQLADSANAGSGDLIGHVQDMAGRCPNTKEVIGGFSQGAGVVDLAVANMSPDAANYVAAIALFGNPTSGLASSLAGIAFPPISAAYAGKTIDQCAQDDPACSGGLNAQAHGTYIANGMVAQAASFAASKL